VLPLARYQGRRWPSRPRHPTASPPSSSTATRRETTGDPSFVRSLPLARLTATGPGLRDLLRSPSGPGGRPGGRLSGATWVLIAPLNAPRTTEAVESLSRAGRPPVCRRAAPVTASRAQE
jgi:hypothetical protein